MEKIFKSQHLAEIIIYSSYKENPSTIQVIDVNELGRIEISLPMNISGIIIEFSFSTNLLTAYVYPEGQHNKRKQCRVQYL